MKFATLFHAVFAVVFFLMASVTVNAKHSPDTHCNVYDLLEDCKESVIDITDEGESMSLGELDKYLIDECAEMSGLLVAKCLMKYLCINHGEEAVDEVRDCVVSVCPLSKRMPQRVCHG